MGTIRHEMTPSGTILLRRPKAKTPVENGVMTSMGTKKHRLTQTVLNGCGGNQNVPFRVRHK